MKSLQKTIKYLAIAFAIFLVINIVFGIIMALTSIVGITSIMSNTDHNISNEAISYSKIFNNITGIDIDVKVSKLCIKNGNTLRVEIGEDNNRFDVIEENSNLIIKEKGRMFDLISRDSIIYVYVPNDFKLNKLKISTGITDVSMSNVEVDSLDLDFGIGNIQISDIKANNITKIDCGVGKTYITNCIFNDLKLDCGLGNVFINSKLLGNNKVNCGIGNLEFRLIDNESDYTISSETGIGVTKLNGNKLNSDFNVGNGENFIKFESGIGNINIELVENKKIEI